MTGSKVEPVRNLLTSDVPKNLGVSISTLYRWVSASAQA